MPLVLHVDDDIDTITSGLLKSVDFLWLLDMDQA
jgi:hypothetical protein